MIGHSIKKAFIKLLPYRCILCFSKSTREQDLCEACFAELPKPLLACTRCANTLSHPQSLCGECIRESPPFEVTHAGFLYEPPITHFITALKFQHQLIYARLLGELLADKIMKDWYAQKVLPELIIPVPLHRQRLKERGFNQAVEIARTITNKINRTIDLSSCLRIKATAPQTLLAPHERHDNIRNAFVLKKPITATHVAVVDDVITTGHTIREFCKLLKKSGVQQIDVWCCARPVFKS